MEDDRILSLYWERNANAIQETNNKYGAYCFSIANNILHSREDSEECVNDTWYKAWNAIPPQRPVSLKMFLAKITRNIAFDKYAYYKAEKRGSGEMSLILDELAECIASGSDVASAYEGKELGRSINQFVKALPARDGKVFLRRYFFAEPAAEIGKRYGLTENHVTVILSRVRKKLRLHLQKEGFLSE